jgi:hypothetical protein
MIRLVLLAAIAALAFATSALALGGSVYAQISANWNDRSKVDIKVYSNHRFNGSVSDVCTPASGPAVTQTAPLGTWSDDVIAHQNVQEVFFDMSAAGTGASCTISVTTGNKLLAEQSYVSV